MGINADGLQYIFENRNSNVEQFDYQANTVMLSIQCICNLFPVYPLWNHEG